MAKISFRDGVLGVAVPDTYIQKEEPNITHNGSYLYIGSLIPQSGPIEKYRTLIHFDVSAIGEANIDSASLTLYIRTAQSSQAAKVRRLTRNDWDEDEATWNDYKYGHNWTSAGGDYTTTDEVDWTMPGTGTSIKITGLEDLVADAIQNRNNNLDLILMLASESGTNVCKFYSGESGDLNKRPILNVSYTPTSSSSSKSSSSKSSSSKSSSSTSSSSTSSSSTASSSSSAPSSSSASNSLIQFVDSTENSLPYPDSEITLDVPNYIEDGNMMIASIALRDDLDITAPDGWTLIAEQDHGTTGGRVKIAHFWKVHSCGDPYLPCGDMSHTFSWALDDPYDPGNRTAAGGLLVYRGVHTVSPIVAIRQTIGQTDSPRVISLTVIDDSMAVASFASFDTALPTPTEDVYPADFNGRFALESTAISEDLTMAVADEYQYNAGAVTAEFNIAEETYWAGVGFTLKPA